MIIMLLDSSFFHSHLLPFVVPSNHREQRAPWLDLTLRQVLSIARTRTPSQRPYTLFLSPLSLYKPKYPTHLHENPTTHWRLLAAQPRTSPRPALSPAQQCSTTTTPRQSSSPLGQRPHEIHQATGHTPPSPSPRARPWLAFFLPRSLSCKLGLAMGGFRPR